MSPNVLQHRAPAIGELSDDPALFSTERLEGLLAGGKSVTQTLKAMLEVANQELNQRFAAHVDIKLIVRRRAWTMDRLLGWLWNRYSFSADPQVALIAVGGYGRGELLPHSDIDVMILFREGDGGQYKDEISAFITQLWDLGLEVGQSVRSLADCVEQATADITVATNLMESRRLCGDPELCRDMQTLTGPSRLWDAKAFFSAKWREQIARHHKHANTEYNLEPDIKNAPGGLRDIQTIAWVAKRYFDASRLSELMRHGFLTESEYEALSEGQAFLWQVRYALHLITRRSENRLLFDYQKQVATLLGYGDASANLTVEAFMKRYYRVAITISQLNDMLLQHFDEAILRADETEQITVINKRFLVRNGFIEVQNDTVFRRTPPALLEIFFILANHPNIEGIRASTIRLIRNSLDLIDDNFRSDIRNTTLFMELLRSPHKLFTQFWRMKRFGILGAYIPTFGNIIGQMQYDLFHVYTVDAHTLLLLRNMRMLRLPESRRDFPMEYIIYQRLPKIELLYLAGLFHDLAKGRKGDHSELGAVEAYDFCLHHRLGKWDAQLVAWLVRHHLLMSITAQKKDVSDPAVIQAFAEQVGDQTRLDYLFALTVPDICATNPSLWNGWKASLLRQLYTETRRALRRGLENPTNRQDLIEETREKARTMLVQRGVSLDGVNELWSGLGDEYFLRESAGNVARHTEAMLQHPADAGPLILIGKTDERRYLGTTQVFIYAKDAPNLFAASVAALNQLNLTIADAKIITASNQFTLDTYVVLEENGAPVDDPQRLAQIRDKLRETLADPNRFPEVVHKRMPRALKAFQVPTEITLTTDLQHNCTVLEVITLDRPGLLADIGRIFMESGVLLQAAKIATFGERAEDVFQITDRGGGIVRNPETCSALVRLLRERLDKPQ